MGADVVVVGAGPTGRGLTSRSAAEVRDASQLDLSYRDGPLGSHVPGPGPRPGDRAPDAPLGDSTLFLRRREADWTVLTTDPGVEVPGATVVLAGHEAAATYAMSPGELVLIR